MHHNWRLIKKTNHFFKSTCISPDRALRNMSPSRWQLYKKKIIALSQHNFTQSSSRLNHIARHATIWFMNIIDIVVSKIFSIFIQVILARFPNAHCKYFSLSLIWFEKNKHSFKYLELTNQWLNEPNVLWLTL